MQYYDLLSSEQRERILTEQLLDRMEEAEEIQNSGPTGYAWHDDDDYEEEQRRREEREREELERSRHNPYGRRFRSKQEPRRVGYGRRRDNNRDNNTSYHKPYARRSANSRSNSNDSYSNNQNNKNTLHKSYACRSARRDHTKPVRPYSKGRPSYKSRRPPR